MAEPTDDLLNELRSLGEKDDSTDGEAMPAGQKPDESDTTPNYAGPKPALNTNQFGRDLAIETLGIEHGVKRSESDRQARDQSSTGLFGDWGKLEQKDKLDWAKSEQEYAKSREGYWSNLRDYVRSKREYLRSQNDPNAEDDPFLGWLERKTTANIGEMQHRRAMAEAIQNGEVEGPQHGDTRAFADATLDGIVGVMSSAIKGVTYGAAYIAGGQDGEASGNRLYGGGDLSKAQQTSLYKFAELTEAWSKEKFPADPIRAQEFKMQMAQGLGSMIGFMGPGIAARVVSGTGLLTMGAIADVGTSAGVMGALQQSGSMTDDALKAVAEGKLKADGSPLTPDDVTAAYLLGLPIGASEALPLGHLFAGHNGHWLKAILVQAFEEGGQEFGQQIAENVTARYIAQYDQDRNWDDQAWDSLAVGALLGAKTEAAVGAYRKVRGEKAGAPTGETVTPDTTTGEPDLGVQQGQDLTPAPAIVYPNEPDAQHRIAASMVPKTDLGREGAAQAEGDDEFDTALREGLKQKFETYLALEAEANGSPDKWRPGLSQDLRDAEDALVDDFRIAGLPGDSMERGAQEVHSVSDIKRAFSKASPEERAQYWVGDGRAAEPTLADTLSQRLAEIEQPDAALSANVEQSAVENVEAYRSAMAEVYADHGLPFGLGEHDVAAVARHMASGLNAEEALQRYAVEAYAQEAQNQQTSRQARGETTGGTAARPVAGGPARGTVGTQGGQAQTRGIPAGTRAGGVRSEGLGAERGQPGGGAAPQRAGGAERTVRPGEGAAEREYQRAVRTRFRSVLAGKLPRAKWQGALNNASDATMQTLLDESIRDGLLRVDRNGIIRRTALAKVNPRETPTRPLRESLAIPADMRVAAAVRQREALTGKPVNNSVQSYAEDLEAARGTTSFDHVLDQIAELKKGDVIELAHLVGVRPTAKTSKAEALKGIQQRHLEYERFLRSAERATDLMALAGEKAKTAPLSSRNLAESMEHKGRTKEQIFKDTGWFRGPDNMWRFEIDDSAAKVANLDTHLKAPTNTLFRSMVGLRSKQQPKWVSGKVKVGTNIKLSDLLQHDKLFAAYPFLKEMRASVMVGPGVPKAKEGGALVFREKGGRIAYSPIVVRAKTQADVLPTLMHEVQHYIQKKEGFAAGSSPSTGTDTAIGAMPLKADEGKPILESGQKFSPTTAFTSRTGEQGDANWRHNIAGMNRAEQLATQIARVYEMLDQADAKGWSAVPLRPDMREYVKGQPNPSTLALSPDAVRQTLLPRMQAELMNALRVTEEDYIGSLGEQEANLVMERLGYTAEQRRKVMPPLSKTAVATKLVTPDFRQAADEVARSAAQSQAIREKWATPQEIAPGITAERDGEHHILFKSKEHQGRFYGGFEMQAALQFDKELPGYAPAAGKETALLALSQKALEDVPGGSDATPIARLNAVADAAEKHLRSMNLLPSADLRLAWPGANIPQAHTNLSDAEFTFWRNRDPLFMADDPRAYKDDLQKIAEDKYGKGTKVVFPGGGVISDKELAAIRAKGDIHTVFAKTATGKWHDLDYSIPTEIPVPADLASAGLDPELWKIRTPGAHEEGESYPSFDKAAARDALGALDTGILTQEGLQSALIDLEEWAKRNKTSESDPDYSPAQYDKVLAAARAMRKADPREVGRLVREVFADNPDVRNWRGDRASFDLAAFAPSLTHSASEEAPPPRFNDLNPRSQRSLEEREAAARAVMQSPEWTQAGEALTDPTQYTHNQPGYGDLNWQLSRKYVGKDGTEIVGTPKAASYLADQAEKAVPGGVAKDKQGFIVIGYPGAGKSTVAKALTQKFRAALMEADQAKSVIPEYEGGAGGERVHRESVDLSKYAARVLMQRGDNIILETLGQDVRDVTKRAEMLRAAGYHVSLVHMDVPKAIAMERAVARFQREGRAIPAHIYDTLNTQDTYDRAHASGAIDDTATVKWDETSQGWHVDAQGRLAGLQDAIAASRSAAGSVDQAGSEPGRGFPGVVGRDGRQVRGGDEFLDLVQQAIAEGPYAGVSKSDRIASFLRALTGEGGGAAQGRPAAQATAGGSTASAGRDKLPVHGRLRDVAIGRWLSNTFERARVEQRAKAQGFTRLGYHGTAKGGAFAAPNAFIEGRDFGFHVSLDRPGAANSRLHYPGSFLANLAMNAAPKGVRRRLLENGVPGSMLPVRLKVSNPLRMPDIGDWTNSQSWDAGMGMKQYGGPPELRAFVQQWESQNVGDVGHHAFSRAIAAELERLGYDGVIYKNAVEAAGMAEGLKLVKNDSLFVWNPAQVRSAFDVFDERAKDDAGLMASSKYVEQDLRERLNGLLKEEGLSAQELFAFRGRSEHQSLSRPQFSEQFRAALPEFATRLQSELERMLPPDIAVKIADRVMVGGDEAYGRYNVLNRLVEVAYRYGEDTARTKGLHEVGHALREYGRLPHDISAGLFSDAEWQVLVERANKVGIDAEIDKVGNADVSGIERYRDAYTKQLEATGFKGDVQARVNELLDQERVMALAEQWANGTDFGAKVNGLLERFLKLLEAVWNAARGLGFRTADDVFAGMASGEVGARAGRREPSFESTRPQFSPGEAVLASPEGLAAQRAMGLMAIKAFHGSPHLFDRFDPSAILSGEGFHAEGWGFYFGSHPEVGKFYKEMLEEERVDGQHYNDSTPHRAARFVHLYKGDRKAAAQYLERNLAETRRDAHSPEEIKMWRPVLALLQSGRPIPKYSKSGHEYQVRIDAEPEQFLDWEKPFSEQSPYVQEALKKSPVLQREARDMGDAGDLDFYENGKEIYEAIADEPKEASETLSKLGIKGNKYLDQESREAVTGQHGSEEAEGSHNFVVYSADDLTITHINGERVGPEEQKQLLRANSRPSLMERLHGLGQSPFDQSLAALTPSPRPFTLSLDGYQGTVETVEKENGDRVRTYKVHPDQGETGASRSVEKVTPSLKLPEGVAFQEFTRPTSMGDAVEIVLHKGNENEPVGRFYFRTDSPDALQGANYRLDASLQRQGIATEIERYVQDKYGKRIVPDFTLSEAEYQRWKKKNPHAVIGYEKDGAHWYEKVPLSADAKEARDRQWRWFREQSGRGDYLDRQSDAASALNQMVVSEDANGKWSLSFFRADDPASRKLLPSIIASIESDLGQSMSPDGWLTDGQYRQFQLSDPDKVKNHRNGGPLFGGLWGSPKAIEMAALVLQHAAAAPEIERPVGAAIKVGDKSFSGPTHFDALRNSVPGAVEKDLWETELEQAFRKEHGQGFGSIEDGFITNAGRYVDREEALKLLDEADNYKRRRPLLNRMFMGKSLDAVELEKHRAKQAGRKMWEDDGSSLLAGRQRSSLPGVVEAAIAAHQAANSNTPVDRSHAQKLLSQLSSMQDSLPQDSKQELASFKPISSITDRVQALYREWRYANEDSSVDDGEFSRTLRQERGVQSTPSPEPLNIERKRAASQKLFNDSVQLSSDIWETAFSIMGRKSSEGVNGDDGLIRLLREFALANPAKRSAALAAASQLGQVGDMIKRASQTESDLRGLAQEFRSLPVGRNLDVSIPVPANDQSQRFGVIEGGKPDSGNNSAEVQAAMDAARKEAVAFIRSLDKRMIARKLWESGLDDNSTNPAILHALHLAEAATRDPRIVREAREITERFRTAQFNAAGKPDSGGQDLAALKGASTPNLDMSPEARKARAEQQGFDTSKVWYRGSALPPQESLIPGTQGRHFHDDADALYFTASPKVAATYAGAHAFNNALGRQNREREAAKSVFDARPKTPVRDFFMGRDQFRFEGTQDFSEGANVAPVYIRPGKQAVIDLEGKSDFALKIDVRAEVKRLKAEGYNTILVRNSADVQPRDLDKPGVYPDELVVFPRDGEYRDIRSVNAAFDPAQGGSSQLLAALKGLPNAMPLGSKASPTGVITAPQQTLTTMVNSMVRALGLTARTGRLNPGLKASAGRQGKTLAGQFDTATGVTRVAIPNDLATLAHEGGHALEVRASIKTELDALKKAHAEELTEPVARNLAVPQLSPTGFSGLELDSDTQRMLVEASNLDRQWRALAAQRAAAKGAPRLFGGFQYPKLDDAAFADLTSRAGVARGQLVRRIGQQRATALIADITGNSTMGRILSNTPLRVTHPDPTGVAVSEIPEAVTAHYVAERYSQTGVPQPRQINVPSAAELSEGFAEWMRQYITAPQQAKDLAPAFQAAFENLLDEHEPAMLETLQGIQEGYQGLLEASPAAAVMSRVQSTVKPGTIGALREEIADKGLKATISDRFYALYAAFFDGRHPMKVAVKQLLKLAEANTGVKLADGEKLVLKAIDDPYKLWRLSEHAKVHATATLQNGVIPKGQVDPVGPSFRDALIKAFGTRRGDWNEEKAQAFGSYLVSRRMLQEFGRFDRGDLENEPDLLIQRSVWRKAMAQLEKQSPEFKDAANLLYAFNKRHLRLKYENGFLTRDLFLDLNARQDYVPLNRIMDESSGPSQMGLKAKGQNKSKMIKRFQGSLRDFINPLESIVQDVYATEARISLNDTVRAMDRLARAAGPGGGSIAERIPAKELKGTSVDIREMLKQASKDLSLSDEQGLQELIDDLFDQNASATIFRPTDTNEKGEPIVYLWEEGKRVPIRLGDDRIGRDIFESFMALGQQNSDPIVDTLSLGTQALRAGVTKAPAYVVVNFLRDQLSNWVLSDKYTPFVTGAKGLKHVVGNDQVAKRYQAFAGQMGGVDAHLIDTAAHKRDIASLRKDGFWGNAAKSALGGAWYTFLRAPEITEAASRMGHFQAAYNRAIEDGLKPEEAAFEAAYAAHDVLDFSRKGSKMAIAARLVAFMNAGLQGLDAARRTMVGERDSFTNYKDLATPYLKAASGTPLSVAEKAALPNSARIWIKMASIGLIGVALAALYRDDPEYDEFNDYMRATHWFFKLFGTWERMPKPFELATPSNAMEAAFDALWKKDPRALKKFMNSLGYTMSVPVEAQAVKMYYEWQTGKDLFRDKDVVSQDLARLPPEMQFNAYTSEFGKMVGKVMGWSPARVDQFVAGMFATLGRDALTISDAALPRINMATGGAIPGVSTTPRADKSVEDYWFLSRFTRRAARGALSTSEFWDQMSQTGGKFQQAASGYQTLLRAGREREARDFIDALPDEQKAFALLEGTFKESDKDLNPMHRARQVAAAMSGIRKEMVLESLIKQEGAKPGAYKKQGYEPEKISLPPSKQRVVNEILEDATMREYRNALIVIGQPGWAQKQIMPTDGLMKELRAASPEVADELEYRLRKGRSKVYPFEGVKEVWPEAKQRLIKEGPDAFLGDLRATASGY